MLHNRPVLKTRRKELRNNSTPAEQQLWGMLQRSNLGGYKFRRQHSVGSYILDFYCPSERLAVELDKSKALGTVNVPDIEQHKCSKCGNTSLSLDEANKVSQFVRDKEQHIIDNLPASDFISLNQAADLLGISKQAFSKHPRVKRGFIYSITIDNKKFFYKRSVEAFRDSKDGRVSLSWPSIINQIEVSVKPEPPREVAFSQP